MLGLRYRTFAVWTGTAALVWAAAHVLLGYLAGAGWRRVHQLTGRVGLALAVVVVVVVLAVAWLLHRRPARRHEDEPRQPVASGGVTTRPTAGATRAAPPAWERAGSARPTGGRLRP
jgi:hypothetical protein